MKKSIALLVSLALILSAGLFAAGQGETAVKAGPAAQVSAPGVFPIVKDKVTLKVFTVQNAIVENLATNTMTKYMEDLTNVRIEWETAPAQAVNEKRTLLLASGDYPDVLFSARVTAEEEIIYGSQGVFQPMNKLIDTYGKEFKKVLAERPLILKSITTPDGNIYSLPHVNECDHCIFGQKMWMNREWLAKLGLKMPATTDELYKVFQAFKTKDPNGNGKADEVPYSLNVKDNASRLPAFIMNAFIYYDAQGTYYSMKDGKVSFVADKPEWKEGIKFIRKLYAEGLIDPASFTQDGVQLTSLGENPDAVILGASAGLFYGGFTKNGAPSNRFTLYDAVPPLAGPAGFKTTGYYPYQFTRGSFVVTNKNKFPEASYKWADHLYSQEATLRTNFGRENEEWAWAKPGEMGINGKPAIWRRISTFGTLQNYHWAQEGPSYRPDYLRLGEMGVTKEQYFTGSGLATRLYQETITKYNVGIVPKEVFPPVYMTKAQASEIAQLRTAIDNYVQESTARFIIGELDIDKSWDAYVKELGNIGVAKYIDISQKAYDAQYGKK